MSDTIFALASAKGRAGVSVIRVSGPNAISAAEVFVGGLPNSVRSLRRFKDAGGQVIDEVLVLCFQTGASFTGEEVVELQCHGSPAVLSRVLQELSSVEGLRLAEEGEFTRRALENDRLDLAQVEGLGALLEAETEAQRKQAVQLMTGALGEKVTQWREMLIRAASLLEAVIDFADEDIPQDVTPEVLELMESLLTELRSEVEGSRIAERIRDGFEVAIVGKPNAGKSTLLNTLSGRDAAITSEIAGTTRDVIELRMDLKGLPITLMDTAGLRDAEDEIERMGIEKAVKRAENADLRVFLTDDGLWDGFDGLEPLADDIVVQSKADLQNKTSGLSLSGKTGAGIEELTTRIHNILEKRAQSVMLTTHARHRAGMVSAITHLEAAQRVIDSGELAAAELRSAATHLNSLIGVVGVENLLDEIFSSFCLGK